MAYDQQSRAVSPEERRADARVKLAAKPDDNLTWLQVRAAFAAADRDDAFAKEDKALANKHDVIATCFHKAAQELESLRERMSSAEKLLVSRLIVELEKKASSPPQLLTSIPNYQGSSP